jgi:hypothetical protein
MHRKETGEDSLCIMPVRNLIKRLKPSVEKIKKPSQGSLEATVVQAKAKLGWNNQLLVHFGKLSPAKLDELKNTNGELPDCYNLGVQDQPNKSNMTLLKIYLPRIVVSS